MRDKITVLPPQALARAQMVVAQMNAEDKKSARARDSRVYAAGQATLDTYALLLDHFGDNDELLVKIEEAVIEWNRQQVAR